MFHDKNNDIRKQPMNDLRIPLIHSYRAAFFVLFVAGFALCSVDGVSQAPAYGWTHPISIAGHVLGTTALLLGVAVWLRRYPRPVRDERVAFYALLGIVVVKVVLAALYPLFG
jgi:hypothetical protein